MKSDHINRTRSSKRYSRNLAINRDLEATKKSTSKNIINKKKELMLSILRDDCCGCWWEGAEIEEIGQFPTITSVQFCFGWAIVRRHVVALKFLLYIGQKPFLCWLQYYRQTSWFERHTIQPSWCSDDESPRRLWYRQWYRCIVDISAVIHRWHGFLLSLSDHQALLLVTA